MPTLNNLKQINMSVIDTIPSKVAYMTYNVTVSKTTCF